MARRAGPGAALVAALGLLAPAGCGDDRAARAPVADGGRVVDPEVARGGSGVAASGPPGTTGGSAAAPATGAEASGPADEPGGPIELEAPPPGRGQAAVLEAAAALPAWSAVLARGRLLERRGQRGAAWGQVVEGPGQTAWLRDETEAGAGLGIALAGAGGRALEVKPGARVVAWGAWAAEGEAEKRWVWRVDRLVGLPPEAETAAAVAPGAGSAASGAALLPSARIGELAAPPPDALPPSQRVQSGMLLFLVVAAPVKPGDGWSVADAPKRPPAALLVLPGEAAVYGGLDYLAPEERWSLERGAWYAAPVTAPSKPPRDGELPVLRAQAAPSRVPPPPAPSAHER